MTINDIIYIILVGVIIFFLLKVGLAILIVAIVICAIYYLFSAVSTPVYTYEQFKPTYEPGRFVAMMPTVPNTEPSGYVNDSWYGPVQQYYNISVNDNPNNDSYCIVPGSTSEYCVHKQVQETGNLGLAMSRCRLPQSTSGGCC